MAGHGRQQSVRQTYQDAVDRAARQEALESALEADGDDGEAWFKLGVEHGGGMVKGEELHPQACLERAAGLGHAEAAHRLGSGYGTTPKNIIAY